MPFPEGSIRVAIAGATSLRGKDLKLWFEESGFPAGEIQLVDEEIASGTLTEVAGEPAIVQSVTETTFDGLRFVFFAGSSEFASKNGPAAERAGASIIDMTGGTWAGDRGRSWIPRLDALITSRGDGISTKAGFPRWIAPSAPGIIACSLSAAFADLSPLRLAIVFLQPVSERGQEGITELEGQTAKLLSLQPIPQEVFDTQVAFNLADRWGSESKERLSDIRSRIMGEVQHYLGGRISLPALTVVQAPVFYGYGFSVWAEFRHAVAGEELEKRLAGAGFKVIAEDEPAPSNLTAAGEAQAIITKPQADGNVGEGYWFWGAADNFRLASVNATQIAERLLAS